MHKDELFFLIDNAGIDANIECDHGCMLSEPCVACDLVMDIMEAEAAAIRDTLGRA